MHPSNEMDREYAVRVLGVVGPEIMQNLRDGVELEDGKAKFNDIQEAGGEGANHWYHVVIQEGRNREVRRLWESQGVQVSRLMRVRYGPITIPSQLKMGRWMMLEGDDVAALYEEVDLKALAPAPVGRAQRDKKLRPLKTAVNKTTRVKDSEPANKSKRGPRIRR
jgi:23S rRNA pseudouridine2605 synthase